MTPEIKAMLTLMGVIAVVSVLGGIGYLFPMVLMGLIAAFCIGLVLLVIYSFLVDYFERKT